MFEFADGGGTPPSNFNLPTYNHAAVHHILLGDLPALTEAINRMAAILGYCEILAWSAPVPTGPNGEHIRSMTRKQTIP